MASQRRSEAAWIEARQRWQINVQKDGQRRTFTSSIKGRKGKHDAETKADEWLESGTVDMRFPQAWDAFLDDQKAHTGASNYAKHECYGRLYIVPQIGNKRLSVLKPTVWQRCIDAAAEAGLSRRSCKNIRSSIAAFLHFCRRNRWTVEQLEDGDITIPNSAAPEKEKTILQPDNIRTLFSESTIKKSGRIVTAHYIHAWRFLVLTGLRRGELCGLRNEDITDTSVTIRRSINAMGEETHGKNDNARRTFALSPLAKRVLADQREYLASKHLQSAWVFPDEWGERANPKSVADRWRFYCGQHGFSTTIHGLRHTFISLGKSDLPLELMKSVVGHSTSMDTYGVYGHDVDGDAVRAASIIENVFEGILCTECVPETKTCTKVCTEK